MATYTWYRNLTAFDLTKSKANITRLLELAAGRDAVLRAGIPPPLIPDDVFITQIINPDYVPKDLPGRLRVISWVCIVVPLVCVMLRFVSRLASGTGIGVDDWLAAAAWAVSTAFATTSLLAANIGGVGQHIWLLTGEELSMGYMIGFYHQIGYGIAMFFLHITILSFYLRVIPGEVFERRLLYLFIAFHIVYLPAYVAVSVVQCLPVRSGYDLYYRLRVGAGNRCIDPAKLVTGLTVITIVTDCMLFLLPLTVVWRLHLTTRKKVMVSGLFLVGATACVASGVRLPYLLRFYKSFDRSYTAMVVHALGHLEVALGLVCACLPMARQAFILLPHSQAYAMVANRFGWTSPQRSGLRIQKIVSGSSNITAADEGTALQGLDATGRGGSPSRGGSSAAVGGKPWVNPTWSGSTGTVGDQDGSGKQRVEVSEGGYPDLATGTEPEPYVRAPSAAWVVVRGGSSGPVRMPLRYDARSSRRPARQ
ncbi:hypothetical protein DRE_03369 [Drechslerella stenobrocha 248]|uniref:Rhodopsin domain-containing protein n=1 Tax=Drechslerella stenobrocha 248 TaxID=1043628 RepID=W7IE16_9PEZI|nr:hypothetical protein DRE_03369 [Drechslerella stenobrocha 248]